MKTKQVLLKGFTFFLTLALLVSDVSLASAKKKKKKGKKKSSKTSSKKSGITNVSQPATQAQTADSRTGYSNNMAGYARGRGGQQSQQQLTPEQEIASLTDKLMACLSPVCEGSIPYEKCFKTSGIDVHFVSVHDCASYLSSASDENIKVSAKNNVKEKIKGYLKEACTEAGGKVSNERCKFSIYYFAKSPDGKHEKLGGPQYLYSGQNFTCTAGSFSISESDLQYELEMDAATKGALINSGIQMGMGVLGGGMKIFQATKKKKELETAEKGSAGCYLFNGSSLEKSHDGSCVEGETLCANDTKSWVSGSTCYHYFEKNITKIEKQEKTAELIRNKVNLSGLKQDAEAEQRGNMLAGIFAGAAIERKLSDDNFINETIDDITKEKTDKKEQKIKGINTIQRLYSMGNEHTAQSEYSKAVSAYNTNQGALNENKEALENAGKDLEKGIGDLTGGVLGGGTQMVTTLMTAKENKGTMTGACYLGNPKSGGTLFAGEGETKKISLK